MKKSLVSLFTLLLCCAALAQGDVHVQFYSPTTVRIVKGGAAPPLTMRTVVGV